MFTALWNQFLFDPLFNALMFFYNTIANYSMGWAVVCLTIALRIVLLPLSFADKSSDFYAKLAAKIHEVDRDHPNDPVKRREIVRIILRRNHVWPWAKVISLGIQLIALIVLYQVFVGGIRETKYAHLYPFVRQPDYLETRFNLFGLYPFDISQNSVVVSLVVAMTLFVSITFSQSGKRHLLSSRDLWYRVLFPLFTFFALVILPSVKAVFILTSILISIMIISVERFIWAFTKPKKKAEPTPQAP